MIKYYIYVHLSHSTPSPKGYVWDSTRPHYSVGWLHINIYLVILLYFSFRCANQVYLLILSVHLPLSIQPTWYQHGRKGQANSPVSTLVYICLVVCYYLSRITIVILYALRMAKCNLILPYCNHVVSCVFKVGV